MLISCAMLAALGKHVFATNTAPGFPGKFALVESPENSKGQPFQDGRPLLAVTLLPG
jgi:hypothetical protein